MSHSKPSQKKETNSFLNSRVVLQKDLRYKLQ